MNAYLRGVAYHLPAGVLTNEDLARQNPALDPAAIFRKTGIRARRVAAAGETSADLAVAAAEKLLAETGIPRAAVDALLFCTQTPDFQLPATACLLQHRLGLPTTCAALDFNQGSSGFTYGLWLAAALVRSGAARTVLLLTGDTLSRLCDPLDGVTTPVFGDAGAAALVTADGAGALAAVGPSVVGTDGRGGEHVVVRGRGNRSPAADPHVRMAGAEVFNFTLTAVPAGVGDLLRVAELGWDDVDLFLLHQANGFILDTLRKRMNLSADRCPADLEDTGNTWGSSLPVLLRRCADRGRLRPGTWCVLAGFGAGYSWAFTLLRVLEPAAEGVPPC